MQPSSVLVVIRCCMSLYSEKQKLSRSNFNKQTTSTIKHAKNYLSGYLKGIQCLLATNPQEIIEAWNEIIGKQYNGLARAIGFKEHSLLVKVYNASLYALLKQTHQSQLITRLHAVVPHVNVKAIQFLLG